jgi:predicted XRE-type DNA-binding protein
MVLDDWRMKVREIAEIIGISKARVGHILHEELNMKKVCVKGCRNCSQQIKKANA